MAVKESQIEARILVDCHLGKVNEVVMIDKKQAESLAHLCDVNEDAIAYAKSVDSEAATVE